MNSGLSISLAAERVGTFLGLPITNSLLMSWVVMAMLILVAWLVGRSLSLKPGKIQNFFEWLMEYMLFMMEQIFGSKTLSKRYFPLVATIFVFILCINMLEFFPLVGPALYLNQGGEHVGLFHTPSADLNFTLALAIISFFVIEFSGVLTLGVLKYGSKFINIKGGAMMFAVGLLEVIGNLARLISFSFRLFGAIFAGEVLVMVITHFLPYIASAPLMGFELFVGLLQAGIFAILTMAFIKIAVEEPHSSGSGQAHGAH
jgi:F-type H+-transporting ATPase subunit a